jgi:hypothetical protein
MKFPLIVVLALMSTAYSNAQQPAEANSTEISGSPALPDAPARQAPQDTVPKDADTSVRPNTASDLPGPIGPVPALLTAKRLTLSDKFTTYAHQAFGPPALFFPAFGAGIRMANPPKNYPREWIDGGGAFGRLYGSALATQTSKRTAAFLTASVLHEDPRYLPAPEGANVAQRIFHAAAFTIVDKTDAGGRTFAFSNFASAAAGGFVGMAYLPDGFNDVHHAGQRASTELAGIAIANIAREFAPTWAPLVQKLHIPRVIPAWWVPPSGNHP